MTSNKFEGNEGDVILVGGGGHALSILESLPEDGFFKGYIALGPSESMPVAWLGTDSDAERLAAVVRFHMAFIYSGLPTMMPRKEILRKYENFGAVFQTVISPTAIVTRHSVIGEGSAVMHRAVVNRSTVGRNSIVNTGAIVEHDCIIGDNTFLAPGVVLGGSVKIGNDCFIGLGSRIKNGVTIVDGVTVGMGCVVSCNLDEPGFYRGNPLRYTNLKRK